MHSRELFFLLLESRKSKTESTGSNKLKQSYPENPNRAVYELSQWKIALLETLMWSVDGSSEIVVVSVLCTLQVGIVMLKTQSLCLITNIIFVYCHHCLAAGTFVNFVKLFLSM